MGEITANNSYDYKENVVLSRVLKTNLDFTNILITNHIKKVLCSLVMWKSDTVG